MRAGLRTIRVLAAAGVLAAAAAAVSEASQAAVGLGVATSGVNSNMRTAAKLDAYKRQVGRMPAIVMWFQNWSPGARGPALVKQPAMNIVHARGAVPLVTWEPRRAGSRSAISAKAIASGRYDAYLRKAAREARRFGHAFYVRPWHELNGRWMPWGVPYKTSAVRFRAAWRHVVTVFRANGAKNVKFIWNPNVTSPNSPDPSKAYPGNKYVDWIALDGYNWGGSRWSSFANIFRKSYGSITRLTKKPLMVAETAAAQGGGSKAAWIKATYSSSNLARFPRIRAIVWFNFKKERDWRVSSSSSSLNAFRQIARRSVTGVTGAQLIRRVR